MFILSALFSLVVAISTYRSQKDNDVSLLLRPSNVNVTLTIKIFYLYLIQLWWPFSDILIAA